MKRKTLINIYKKILIDIIINYNSFRIMGRKDKFNINTYLNPMLDVLFFGDTWNHVRHCRAIHISTIIKKFHKWSEIGIFKEALEQITNTHINKKIKELFIDSTCIQNMNCSSDSIKYYNKIKSKKQIKLSILATNNNIPVTYHLSDPTIHDSKHIPILISNIRKNNIRLVDNCHIIGDKGYITKRKIYFVNKKRVKIHAPYRKNQKKKQYKKVLFNERYVVEQTFSHLKRSYKRLQIIYDRNLKSFETFLIMAITCQIIRKYK